MSVKHSQNYDLYAAMNGYDAGIANPYDSNGDPAIRNRIFRHDCSIPMSKTKTLVGTTFTTGYYNFISDVRSNMHCDADFSLKTVTTATEYNRERSISLEFLSGNLTKSASGTTGMYI